MSFENWPAWEPFTSKSDKGISKGDWNLNQLNKFLAFKPAAKPKQILSWLENETIHPQNPHPTNADCIRKLLKRAREDIPTKSETPRKKRKVETSGSSSIIRKKTSSKS